jgi:hypothetical protein
MDCGAERIGARAQEGGEVPWDGDALMDCQEGGWLLVRIIQIMGGLTRAHPQVVPTQRPSHEGRGRLTTSTLRALPMSAKARAVSSSGEYPGRKGRLTASS